MSQQEQRRRVHYWLWILLFNWKMEVLRMSKYKSWDIVSQEKGVHVIQLTFYLGNTKECGNNQDRHLVIKTLKRYIQQFCSKQAIHFIRNFRKRFIYIIFGRQVIQDQKQICYKNTHLYALTFLVTSFKMKKEKQKTGQKNGLYS